LPLVKRVGQATKADGPKVLERALSVLDLFTERRPEWTAAEIGEATELPVSTTYRIVNALESHGLLRHVGSGYRLGAAAVTLGRRASAGFDLGAVLRPVLEALASEIGETTVLAIFDATHIGALCIDRIEAPQQLRLSLEIGSVLPLHAGATAKALLASLGDEVLEAVVARPLPKLAANTITEPKRLREEVASIRAQGYAVSFEETNTGAWGIAVPIFASDGAGLASIGVAAPISRHSQTVERAALRALRSASERAAVILGYER
jgi:DNA-binding IclR family transcriptional regulator